MMTTAEKVGESDAKPIERSLVLVSGYYGFGNLGDEAILEELLHELKQLVRPEQIVVLSANPQLTESRFGVRAQQRKSLIDLWSILPQARLFISGGGGLFQNTKTLGSILFYGLQILMARAHGVTSLVYAQGIGPLRGSLAENICRQIFTQANQISVRDDASLHYLESWGLKATRTADPVWKLAESELPAQVQKQLIEAGCSRKKSRCVGLSLRPSPLLTGSHLKLLAEALSEVLSRDDQLLLLPLQADQDLPVLKQFEKLFAEKGRQARILETAELELPSQWLSVFAQLKFLVSMRLHAIIMAISSGKAVCGIAYDPKVSQLLDEFGQSCLLLSGDSNEIDWPRQIKSFVKEEASYANLARNKSAAARQLAHQNFEILAGILKMPGGNS